MRLRCYYWGLVVSWHLLLVVMAYYLLYETYYWFMLAQLGVFVSLIMAYRVYRHFRRPLELVKGGKSALQDRDFSVKYRMTGAREVDELIQTYNDMIETLRKERTLLQEQHFFLRKLVEASPSGILIMDHDGRITETNPVARQLLGFDPVDRNAPTNHPLLEAAHELALGTTTPLVIDGTHHYRLEASAFVDRGFHRKFVQIQTLTGEILAAEKRAYGKVIRMMAHEVNNSIGAISALLDTLRVPPEETNEQWVADVLESLPIASKRNHRLNIFMRNFADVVRLPQPQRERIDLAKLLRETVLLFQPQARQQGTILRLGFLPGKSDEPVRLPTEKSPEHTPTPTSDLPPPTSDLPPPTSHFPQADPNQLQQVLVNVLKNALESLQVGGEVQVILTGHPHQIIIADNGPGLDAEAAVGVFTPFYTTKPKGQGIGLTLVREILSNHDYSFSLTTGTDGWTRFVITL